MKVLCIADIIDPLVYSVNIKERFSDVHLVLSAGDIPMQYLGFIASSLNCPVLFVFGNHNLKFLEAIKTPHKLAEPLNIEDWSINGFGATYVGDRIEYINGLLIAGLGGSIRYNQGQNQFTNAQMFLKMLKLIPRLIFNKVFYGRYLDILLTHSPPYKLNDQEDIPHQGFKAFRVFMRLFKPKYILHGHIHLYDQNINRIAHFYHTKIINVYKHFILYID